MTYLSPSQGVWSYGRAILTRTSSRTSRFRVRFVYSCSCFSSSFMAEYRQQDVFEMFHRNRNWRRHLFEHPDSCINSCLLPVLYGGGPLWKHYVRQRSTQYSTVSISAWPSHPMSSVTVTFSPFVHLDTQVIRRCLLANKDLHLCGSTTMMLLSDVWYTSTHT